MLRSDWKLYAGIGIAIGIVVGSYLIHRWDSHHYYESPQVNQQFEGSGVAVVDALPAPDQEQHDYIQGKRKPNYDTRSVWAAEDAAYWAMVAAVIGGAGTIFVAFSLIFSAGATRAALDAAKFAQRALVISEKDYIATHRPIVRFNTCEFDTFDPNIPLTCKVTMINFGASNALIFMISAGFITKNGNIQKYLGPDIEEHEQKPLIPGEQFEIEWTTNHSFSRQLVSSIRNGTTELYFDGTVSYRDGNGIIRATGFTRRYDIVRRKFRRIPSNHEFSDGEYES